MTAVLHRNTTVDRSAIQWIRLEIDGNGQLVAVNNQSHGRIYDACEVAPFWYYFPSLMVNAVGDMVVGFSGSSEYSFISAFYTTRQADGTLAERPGLIKTGEDYFLIPRWGDYSNTSLDPEDELTFWTVQEYARPRDLANPSGLIAQWGTWIAGIEVTP